MNDDWEERGNRQCQATGWFWDGYGMVQALKEEPRPSGRSGRVAGNGGKMAGSEERIGGEMKVDVMVMRWVRREIVRCEKTRWPGEICWRRTRGRSELMMTDDGNRQPLKISDTTNAPVASPAPRYPSPNRPHPVQPIIQPWSYSDITGPRPLQLDAVRGFPHPPPPRIRMVPPRRPRLLSPASYWAKVPR